MISQREEFKLKKIRGKEEWKTVDEKVFIIGYPSNFHRSFGLNFNEFVILWKTGDYYDFYVAESWREAKDKARLVWEMLKTQSK